MVESLSLEVFRQCGDVALRDVASGHGGDASGLDLVNLVVYYNLSDSMKKIKVNILMLCSINTTPFFHLMSKEIISVIIASIICTISVALGK